MLNLKNVTLRGSTIVVGAIVGSTLIALNIGLNWLGFCFFLASNLATLSALKGATGDGKAMVWVNYFFVLVNIIGLMRA
jgi:hypothetical protein